jgi:hypothetical protein
MALVVGVFESVFFRGFIQNRLEAQFGHAWGIGGAAALYGLYHVGYGMGLEEILFLSGLGVIYAVAFSLTRSLLVLWPLLSPLGSFFANVRAGDIELPWTSIAEFLDVLGVMLLVLWLARRHLRRRAAPSRAARSPAGVAQTPGRTVSNGSAAGLADSPRSQRFRLVSRVTPGTFDPGRARTPLGRLQGGSRTRGERMVAAGLRSQWRRPRRGREGSQGARP